MTKRLSLRSHLDVHSGYGMAIYQTFTWLQKNGIFVTLRPIGINEMFGQTLPKEMRAQIVQVRQPEEFELLFAPPTNVPTVGRKTVTFTMWESQLLQPMNVTLLSQMERIVVPCQWCADSFVASGVKRPISVVSLGFDPTVYFPTPISETGPTVFGIAGRVAHCPKRKMIQEAIDLFVETFKGVEDVRLHVKIHPDDVIKLPLLDKRVKVFKDVMEPYQLANWLHGLTAYVTLARAEGFGLWALQAMACGRPVVGCRYSGQADFMTAENSFCIPFKEITVDGVGDSNVAYDGVWANPDIKVAGATMLTIHRNRKLAIEKGKLAAESVKALTWENSTDKLIAVLEEVGVWK